ncbi:class I SAM-dependent methyltransferase [Facklamia sp. DSM 111018]|uniref:Class I SAM-dependent methyltransferase n=1 Tax=Facklamia lactis TaxID=2749967 RepID=A0ABS0LRC8_9LACT|nr:class I SAM-dependent methyltransferase [Facklamia lactis]MBG9986720.1 class I SAM-dependent methyltransferase [Facklamia lactis]
MTFSQIAEVYDRFNDRTVYDQWLMFTLDSTAGQTHKALDVACGTGYFTRLLASHCQMIKGVDIDPAMIAIAQDKTNKEISPKISFVEGDMTDLSALEEDFDLVTCFADALCFLDSSDQVEKALASMTGRLKTGGLLLFDVWTPYQLSEGFSDFSYHDEDDDGALLWRSFMESDQYQVVHELTVYDRYRGESETDLFTRKEVDLTERTYPLEDYMAMLNKVGFDNDQIQVTIDFGKIIYDPKKHKQVDRWFFICEKA